MNGYKKRLGQIAQEFNLDIIYAFGSYAKDVSQWIEGSKPKFSVPQSSDLDIGVKPSPEKLLSVKEKVLLSIAFEDLFSLTRVDLLNIPEVDPFFAANIIRGERLYCRDEYEGDEYELYILRRAGDLAPFEKERIALIMEGAL